MSNYGVYDDDLELEAVLRDRTPAPKYRGRGCRLTHANLELMNAVFAQRSERISNYERRLNNVLKSELRSKGLNVSIPTIDRYMTKFRDWGTVSISDA
jgi:hypothetical protein